MVLIIAGEPFFALSYFIIFINIEVTWSGIDKCGLWLEAIEYTFVMPAVATIWFCSVMVMQRSLVVWI